MTDRVGEGQAGPSATNRAYEVIQQARKSTDGTRVEVAFESLHQAFALALEEAASARPSWARMGDLAVGFIELEAALRASEAALAEALKRNTELPIKYGRDHSATLQELIDKFQAAQPNGVNAFCDVVDAEFIFGCYGHAFRHEHEMAKDIRGMLWALCSDLRASRAEATKAEEARQAFSEQNTRTEILLGAALRRESAAIEAGARKERERHSVYEPIGAHYCLECANAALRAPQPPEPEHTHDWRCAPTCAPSSPPPPSEEPEKLHPNLDAPASCFWCGAPGVHHDDDCNPPDASPSPTREEPSE